ncbi:unnamed protein product [Amoebophrya sp. A120]|nr:unnamed protein product [Amoebophrya sp. A120]|eukprot:GSA120T00010124001.1
MNPVTKDEESSSGTSFMSRAAVLSNPHLISSPHAREQAAKKASQSLNSECYIEVRCVEWRPKQCSAIAYWQPETVFCGNPNSHVLTGSRQTYCDAACKPLPKPNWSTPTEQTNHWNTLVVNTVPLPRS